MLYLLRYACNVHEALLYGQFLIFLDIYQKEGASGRPYILSFNFTVLLRLIIQVLHAVTYIVRPSIQVWTPLTHPPMGFTGQDTLALNYPHTIDTEYNFRQISYT